MDEISQESPRTMQVVEILGMCIVNISLLSLPILVTGAELCAVGYFTDSKLLNYGSCIIGIWANCMTSTALLCAPVGILICGTIAKNYITRITSNNRQADNFLTL